MGYPHTSNLLSSLVQSERMKRKWSQYKLAAETGNGTTQTHISCIETGRLGPLAKEKVPHVLATLNIQIPDLEGALKQLSARRKHKAPPQKKAIVLAPPTPVGFHPPKGAKRAYSEACSHCKGTGSVWKFA